MELIDTEKILNKTDLFWQYPVITEQEFYNQNKDDPNYFGFPWATIIDKRININELFKLLINNKKHNNYYTCCQHILFRKLIPLFFTLGIKTVYTPHKIKGEDEIKNIKLMPCPLYAVNFEDKERNIEFRNIDYIKQNRNYLYSFVGGYQKGYLTNIREKIFKLNKNENNYIINTGDWHFNSTVYSKIQNKNKELNTNKLHNDKRKLYNNILLNSKFTLCPSGSGPNSIRFWEALACGSIPVLLSDKLELPYNINWKEAIIFYPEKDIENIEHFLKNINSNEENKRRKKCIELYKKIKNNFKNYLIN